MSGSLARSLKYGPGSIYVTATEPTAGSTARSTAAYWTGSPGETYYTGSTSVSGSVTGNRFIGH